MWQGIWKLEEVQWKGKLLSLEAFDFLSPSFPSIDMYLCPSPFSLYPSSSLLSPLFLPSLCPLSHFLSLFPSPPSFPSPFSFSFPSPPLLRMCTSVLTTISLLHSIQEIVGYSCSWCGDSYHPGCFNQQLKKEACHFGPLRNLIIPPSWIVRTPAIEPVSTHTDDSYLLRFETDEFYEILP